MSDTVRVEFDTPLKCEVTKKAWKLTGGDEPLFLPKSHTFGLERDDDDLVVSALVSSYIAEKRGLLHDDSQEKPSVIESHSVMSRDDWYWIALLMAMVIRGVDNPVWEARKLFREVVGE